MVADQTASSTEAPPVRPPGDGGRAADDRGRAARERWPFRVPVLVLVLGLVVTGVLTWASQTAYVNNEKRLLRLRVREAGSVLSEALPAVQTPLASATALAASTGGNASKFRGFIAGYVGPSPHPFVTASLWRVGALPRGPVTTVGAAAQLPRSTPEGQAFLARAARSRSLAVMGMLTGSAPRLGYALGARGPSGGYVTYAEASLPPRRRAPIQRNQAFSDLNYALYLGRDRRPSHLLFTSEPHLPIAGTHATETVPFGDSALTLVMAPRTALGGRLSQELPWIILGAGVLLSLGAAGLTVGLTRRRRAAERLADRLEQVASENRRLYSEQRNIAQTLQHALLPQDLPRVPGVEAQARFVPGEHGVEIGGDWYDAIVLGGGRVLVVVGDVSGRGLRAAATMASLRYAIHAYAAEGDDPASILSKLCGLVSIGSGGRLATVLCALVDLDARSLSLTSAGHLPPLLVSNGGSEYLSTPVGLPVGVEAGARYESTTVTVPAGSTFLAYTDGLIERRGEDLDRGLARLRSVAAGGDSDLASLLARVLDDMRDGPSEDDTAILGLRWTK